MNFQRKQLLKGLSIRVFFPATNTRAPRTFPSLPLIKSVILASFQNALCEVPWSCKITTSLMGPLQDPVTWYGINYTGTQMTQWDFQNKGKSRWTGKSSFVLEVPLRHLRPSVIYSVPCDWILQRAYSHRR